MFFEPGQSLRGSVCRELLQRHNGNVLIAYFAERISKTPDYFLQRREAPFAKVRGAIAQHTAQPPGSDAHRMNAFRIGPVQRRVAQRRHLLEPGDQHLFNAVRRGGVAIDSFDSFGFCHLARWLIVAHNSAIEELLLLPTRNREEVSAGSVECLWKSRTRKVRLSFNVTVTSG